MKSGLLAIAFAVLFTAPLHAQQASPSPNAAQTGGRAIFSKSCAICHLSPQIGCGFVNGRI